jgi:hypothetical protein
MVSDEERKKAARAEALRKIELERQGKIPPNPLQFLIAFPVLILMNYYLFNHDLKDSIGRAAWLVIIIMIFSYLLYRFRKYRYSKREEK